MCERRVDLLFCSLPLHRHSYIGFILAFASSFHNKQRPSKTPDILSRRAYTEEFLASLNAQAQAPDDPSKTLVSNSHLLSLRGYMEELSTSCNDQDQVPDDLHVQDRQCSPCIFVDCFHLGQQELVRFTTKEDVSHLSFQLVSQNSTRELFNRLMTLPYQGVSRIEFHVCCLWIPVVSQGVVCFYGHLPKRHMRNSFLQSFINFLYSS